MPTERERRFVGPRRGQLIFALFFVSVSILLLSQIGSQTKWVENSKLFAQPRFWPAVGLAGMVLLGAAHLYLMPWRRITRDDVTELRKWAQVLEFAAWFMAYVLLVPLIGYLPVTMAFMPLLTWRMGYRQPGMLWLSVGFAVAVVVLFKGLLSVKIPGGAIYEFLPGALRSFFILYL